jgi:uncharacterized protein DUF5694
VTRSFLLSASLMAISLPSLARESSREEPAPLAARAEVLVLGTYHMANPGRDIHNMQADDVLAPKRQAEIAHLIEALKRFRPTKIAVERNVGDERIPRDYADYLAGRHELTRNEIEQVGFRLAKEMGHTALYPVDADGDFPYPRLVKYAQATGRSKELDAISDAFGAEVKAQGEYLASHTILEALLYINADEKVARELGLHQRMAHLGENGDWAGADLLADWYRRNARIFTNVTRIVDSPNERVLVIFGAGHLGLLREAVSTDPTLRLRTLGELTR